MRSRFSFAVMGAACFLFSQAALAEIAISYPDSDTVWMHGQSTYCEWSGALGSGLSISIDIYKGGDYLDLYHMLTANDGHVDRTEPIPASWGTGSDFQLKLMDGEGNYGWSESFTIVPEPATVLLVGLGGLGLLRKRRR